MKNIQRTISYILFVLALSAGAISCGPKQGTIEDKEAVKGDTLDMREGEGEGPVGEDDHK